MLNLNLTLTLHVYVRFYLFFLIYIYTILENLGTTNLPRQYVCVCVCET